MAHPGRHHLLVRVPHRPEAFDVPLEVMVARLERALGETAAAELQKQLAFRRVAHFTRVVMFGSRGFVDGWFERNRSIVKGRSQLERKRGSRSLGQPALRGLYSLRDSDKRFAAKTVGKF